MALVAQMLIEEPGPVDEYSSGGTLRLVCAPPLRAYDGPLSD
jgi:hypothetical protein